MAIQTTGVRYVSEGVDAFVQNVQRAQANLDAMTKNTSASTKAIRDAASDLNTHTQSLNAMTRSTNALNAAQRLSTASTAGVQRAISGTTSSMTSFSRISSAASFAFSTLSKAGSVIPTVFRGITSTGRGVVTAVGGLARGFTGLLASSRDSLARLTGFGAISRTLQSDLFYLTRRVIALSAAFAALDAIKGFIGLGFQQVALYDRMSHSVAALTANELISTGAVSNFSEGLKQAIPFTKQMLDWIEKLAVVSIFESGDIQAVQQFGQSVGMSAKDAAAMTFALTAWGTVTDKQPHTLSLIANALTDMFSKGKVQSQEMRQLALNGIPAWDMLAKGLGVSVEKLREMVTEGLVPADEGIRILVSSMASTYGPALGDFAFSISGITSSLKDIAKINAREMFRGIVEAAMPFMERIVSVLTQPETKERFQEIGRSIGETATKAFEFVEALIASGDPLAFIALKIDEALPGFYHLYQQLDTLAGTFAEIAKKAFGWGDGIGKGIAQGILSAASAVVAAVQKIADIINDFLSGKISPRDAISGAMGDIANQTGQGTPATPPTPGGAPGGGGGGGGGAPPELPGGMGSTLGFGNDLFDPLTQSLDRLNAKADEAKKHWDDLRGAFEQARQKAEENIPGFQKLEPVVAGLGTAFGVILTSGLASAALGLLKMLTPIGLLSLAGAGLYSAWENNLFGIRDRVNEVIPVVQEKFGQIKDYLSGPFINDVQRVVDRFKTEWENGQIKVENASDAINRVLKKDVLPIFNEVSEFLEKKLGPVIEEIAVKSVPLLQAALRLLGGIFENIVIPMIRLAWEVFSTLLWPVIELGAKILVGVLFPALTKVFDFINDNILPVYRTWYEFLSGSVIPIIERLSTIIILLIEIAIKDLLIKWKATTDAITEVWKWINTLIDSIPGLRGAIDGVIQNIQDIIGWFNNWWSSISSIKGVIQDVINFLDNLISKLQEVSQTQSAVLGHSPSPLEMSLRGIGITLKDVIKIFQYFTRGLIDTGRAAEGLADDFQDIAADVRDFIDDLEELRLTNLIDGLDQVIDNLQYIREFKLSSLEDLEDLNAYQKDVIPRIAQSVRDQLRAAQQEFLVMAETDPENAEALFELKSKQIRELSEMENAIIRAKTQEEKNALIEQRNFLMRKQQLELELFEQQAQRRSEALEREADALVSAFAKAWTKMISDHVIPTPDLTQLYNMLVLISQIDLPDWLRPGSPTPLENALVGIGNAVKSLSKADLPQLRFQLQQVGSPATLGQIMSSSYMYTYSPQYNLGVTTNQSPQYAFQSFELMQFMYRSG